MEIVLISCVGLKKSHECKAKDLYDSTWFRYAWQYAQSLNPDKIFILSAKYGLINPEKKIIPYEETLNSKSTRDIRSWAASVLGSLQEAVDVTEDTFIILAGEKYRRYLIGHLSNHVVPMQGLGIGMQLKWLKERCVS
ncbi:MAG: hypothetical protein HGB26_02775 [Desulfobulbaceae bacterium]|nr:hypothetical protein [Desulfobulbaceae bacterium]